MRTEPFIEELECTITRNECRARGKELARQHQLRKEHALNAAYIKNKLANEKKEIDAEIERLADIVHTGKERRPIQCQEVANDRKFEIMTIRGDTGEVLRDRPMDAAERKQSSQGDLFAFQAGVARAAQSAVDAENTPEDDEVEVDEEEDTGAYEEDEIAAHTAAVATEDGLDIDVLSQAVDDDPEPAAPVRLAGNAKGSVDTPVAMPGAVNLGPTAEDKRNWAKE